MDIILKGKMKMATASVGQYDVNEVICYVTRKAALRLPDECQGTVLSYLELCTTKGD